MISWFFNIQSLYWRPEGLEHPFRESVRLKLVALLIERRPPTGGENLKLKRCEQCNHIFDEPIDGD